MKTPITDTENRVREWRETADAIATECVQPILKRLPDLLFALLGDFESVGEPIDQAD